MGNAHQYPIIFSHPTKCDRYQPLVGIAQVNSGRIWGWKPAMPTLPNV
ncbi:MULTISPECIES: hypothetical protein [Moorena]|uniref:Uncharacterized protein n=1 Tax=Moorena producens 3L TaxID=489825 RepID=F4XRV9_9CYAN|nr:MULTISPECIES: hypothetical protein [Moorena]NEQ14209.1 hypothetical protein [Moorena sp. SIO3E2]EGJ32678.1 hypothetical protein LYNGBM3L_05340 [Moorena producens 3L]NEP36326.1 hypothetical protein [Moorena sp. SIO3B2]NEP65162.1 hypothetical protein [Moorena sp. SIO3A5]NER87860.1 hypothetical protein [Moorena sp. SIO3A2]